MAKDSYVVNPSPPSPRRTRFGSDHSSKSNNGRAITPHDSNALSPEAQKSSSLRQRTNTGKSFTQSEHSTAFSLDDTDPHTVNVLTTRVGIYGWRKYCLYLTVLLLVCLSIVNLGMLVFIFRILNLDKDSAGPLKFKDDSLLVRGRAEFTEGILAANISGFDNSTLLVESNQQIIMRSFAGVSDRSALVIDGSSVEMSSRQFDLTHLGTSYFSSSQRETRISSNDVVVETDTGMRVSGVVQTSRISNTYDEAQGLTLQSVGQQLSMQATENVTLESTTNRVEIKAFQGVNIQATTGNIVFAAQNLQLVDLPTSGAGSTYSLCLCANGKLFRVPTTTTCAIGSKSVC
eukprot:m.8065 g.8065  ORF g.8065 m.8065 type:complete len:346 (-) comp5369_c1_seq1:90-1127(-)